MKKFILVVEEDVVSVLDIPTRPKFQDITNACLNNPVFVEIPMDSEVDKNWTWDGTDFYPPES
jgi:hypothetical protein